MLAVGCEDSFGYSHSVGFEALKLRRDPLCVFVFRFRMACVDRAKRPRRLWHEKGLRTNRDLPGSASIDGHVILIGKAVQNVVDLKWPWCPPCGH